MCSTVGLASIGSCVITSNHGGSQGGGVLAPPSPQAITSIRNSTIGNNDADHGGGVVGRAEIYNSIAWGNVAFQLLGNQLYVGDNQIGVSFSDIQGGQADVYVSANGLLSWYGGNISANPVFVQGQFQIASGSPCIDAGRNTDSPSGPALDAWRNSRFFDDVGTVDTGVGPAPIIDMGAYEFNGQTSTLADSDGDGVPDAQDQCPNTISGAAVGVNGCPANVPGDLDGDGDVDQTDFGILQRCMSGADVPANPNCQ